MTPEQIREAAWKVFGERRGAGDTAIDTVAAVYRAGLAAERAEAAKMLLRHPIQPLPAAVQDHDDFPDDYEVIE